MKILFTSVSAHGHLLPMAPLMQAALDAGHRTAVMVSADLEPLVRTDLPAGVEFLPAGPMPFTLATEAARRTGEDVMQPSVTGIGETFGGVLLDLSATEAVPAARAFAPDLVVADMYSTLGEYLAATLDVPWYRFALSVALPPDWAEAVDSAAAQRFRAADLSRRPPTATVDVWPPELSRAGADHVRLRTAPHSRAPHSPSHRPGSTRSDTPRVLLTLGTTFSDTDLLTDVARRVTDAGVEVVATRGMVLGQDHHDGQDPLPGVRWVPFTPLDELLDGVDLVVGVGGAGTVLAALSRGLPLVLWPQGADQPRIADQVARAGAGVVAGSPDGLTAAVTHVLADPSFRVAAESVAAGIAAAPTPAEVLSRLLEPIPA